MEAASLENETLRTKLKECQDALEAQAREGQTKDLKYFQLLFILNDNKIKHSSTITSYFKEKQKTEKKQKALTALTRKLDVVYEELSREREKSRRSIRRTSVWSASSAQDHMQTQVSKEDSEDAHWQEITCHNDRRDRCAD